MATEKGRIVSGGCGGFLNPPTHPEHTMHVETDLRRKPENRGMMSLSYAAGCEWLDSETRQAARRVLNNWQRLALDDPSIQDWICHVLGYFRGCYVRPFASRNVDQFLISKTLNPLANAHMHAGIQLIRDYYPEFHPSQEHFTGAYWGSKPA
jgi:hypothetical protein